MMIPVGCIILDNPPFDLLLGRVFMEKLRGTTDWEKGTYTFHYHNRQLEIDGVGGAKPRIYRKPLPNTSSSPFDQTSKLNQVTFESDSEGSDSDGSDEERDEDDEEAEIHSLILQAMDVGAATPLQSITMNELITEEAQGNIAFVYLLTQVPAAPRWDDESCHILSIQSAEPSAKVNEVTFSSDQYGFSLEAPKCRDIMSNTPVKLVPGLEEHLVYVGDLPEVDEHMEETKTMFEKHKGCFPKSGEMSRTLDSTKLQAPASFHTDPTAYTRKYYPEQIRILNNYVDVMVRADKMQKSSSPVSCNPLLVAMKDGAFRVCVNFIPVNKMIQPMAWPIPDPMTEIYKLQGCEWLSFWDS
ncbi:hypothetical protein EC957_008689 [Mortierella hygrophila]|uniref:Uncharacterized protein n=1 Tax=Mortierella hygrophila TaxID=979708 RepID=A0A9P6EXD0_9FUNG|nr:hypothetical protein EC957_008689 [Mortierella hygrophila]